MSPVGRRLALLEAAHRRAPAGCAGAGTHCVVFTLVGDGSADPAAPAPARSPCPRCGRPVFERVIVLVGVANADRV